MPGQLMLLFLSLILRSSPTCWLQKQHYVASFVRGQDNGPILAAFHCLPPSTKRKKRFLLVRVAGYWPSSTWECDYIVDLDCLLVGKSTKTLGHNPDNYLDLNPYKYSCGPCSFKLGYSVPCFFKLKPFPLAFAFGCFEILLFQAIFFSPESLK